MGLRKKDKAPISEPRQPEAYYIGIDQSYTGFGFVVLDDKGHCHQKTLRKYTLSKKENDGDGERLVRIYNDLLTFFGFYAAHGVPVYVSMEGYAYGAKLNREKLGELGGVVKLATRLVLYSEPTSIPPTTLKAFATGNGRASKEDMVRAAQEFDPEITNDNLADAYLLAVMQSEA